MPPPNETDEREVRRRAAAATPPRRRHSHAMGYWDATLRALRRPVYGLADDDGFVYSGDSNHPAYRPWARDTAPTDGPAWFRFGMGWIVADVPTVRDARYLTAADVSRAIDAGAFYASSGLELDSYNVSDPYTLVFRAAEPCVFGATGGSGADVDGEPREGSAPPLDPFNLTLCAAAGGGGGHESGGGVAVVTNLGCVRGRGAPPAARTLVLDLRALPEAAAADLLFVRVQASVRARYRIAADGAPSGASPDGGWAFGLEARPRAEDVAEGRLVYVAGASARRPFVVASSAGRVVRCVSHFGDDESGEVTPNNGYQGTTSIDGIVGGVHELVAERWMWAQPVFRRRDPQSGALFDPATELGGTKGHRRRSDDDVADAAPAREERGASDDRVRVNTRLLLLASCGVAAALAAAGAAVLLIRRRPRQLPLPADGHGGPTNATVAAYAMVDRAGDGNAGLFESAR